MVQVMTRCGKHAERPFGDAAATDPSYCAWVLREKADGRRLSRDLKSFANYVQDVHGGVLVVGKHAGRFSQMCYVMTLSTVDGQPLSRIQASSCSAFTST